ncbi:MAG: hypothetical protein DRG78_02675 [Epsilonproteobacteria bacterium]|nr:MAG: hypothetical protein DRG78_02675 [Campylobacterota bacterium]
MKIDGMKLIDYDILVKKMAIEQTNDLVDNDTINHAAILVSELVKTAKTSIKLYTDSFCKDFYSKEIVRDSFIEAAKKNIKLEIIADNCLARNNILATAYKDAFAENLMYKDNISVPIKATFSFGEAILHNFMIIDDRGIRYEQEKKDDICNNLEDVKARATFNRPEDVKPFLEAFNNRIALP